MTTPKHDGKGYEASWVVQTPYGQVDCQTYLEAKLAARDAAKVTGRACKVEKRGE